MMRLTCNFQGRLGNLMFEIAAVLATAKRQGMIPSFPKFENDYYHGIPAFQQYLKPILSQFDKWTDTHAWTNYEDTIGCYTPLPTFERDTMLRGYFTCSQYFNDYRRELIELFRTDGPTVERNVEAIRRAHEGRRTVAVHVRRTDYVTDYGWDLSPDYYERAARLFPGAAFIVFSDDQEWCRQHLDCMPRRTFVSELDYIELQMMGRFDAMILANSTFSTWGAILGDPNMDKEIVGPKIWIPQGKGNHNKDIVEPHWTLL